MEVSKKESFWQEVIDEFYKKYNGIATWHTELMQKATTTGIIRMPTGRFYSFSSTRRNNDLVWPRTKILNYPVQGLAADILSVIRVSIKKKIRLLKLEAKLVSTIHDSVVIDAPSSELKDVCQLLYKSTVDFPENFFHIFGYEFNLPTRCEISFGPNKYDLKECNEYGIIVV